MSTATPGPSNNCTLCKHFDAWEQGHLADTDGICRRFPPSLPGPLNQSVQPYVTRLMVCGEFVGLAGG